MQTLKELKQEIKQFGNNEIDIVRFHPNPEKYKELKTKINTLKKVWNEIREVIDIGDVGERILTTYEKRYLKTELRRRIISE